MSSRSLLGLTIVLLCLQVELRAYHWNETLRDAAANQMHDYMGGRKGTTLMTKGSGNPNPDRGNVMTVGARGPIVLQDTFFIEEMQHFDRERIPERVVHAKGGGAFGYFVVTNDITQYTKATVFSKVGKKTPILVRFSTVIGETGSADTVRDPRGFAIKFYTDEGIWDLVGNNTPVFFVRDPLLFFSFIHSQKRNPVTHLRDYDMYWDFLSLRPESLMQVMILFSDKGIPDGFRHMSGYGSNTFKLVNENNEPVYCKFHYKTAQGERGLPVERAQKLAGVDPDYGIRDLYNNIALGKYPSWTFYIQVMSFKEAEEFRWNPFDVTKIWPEDDFPLIEVGRFTLDKNPRNYFTDIEQAGFNPGNMVPGIEPSPDKMLQGRLFSYLDTHHHRLGPNHQQLPVNSPFRSPVFNTQRDGKMCYRDNQNGAPNYYPSSFVHMANSERARPPPISTTGDIDRYDSSDDDNYSQPAMMWQTMLSEDERQRMVNNIANHLRRASSFIQERQLGHFFKVDKKFGSMLQAKLQAYSAI
nr:catalase isoform X2 [Halyomorpha halys]